MMDLWRIATEGRDTVVLPTEPEDLPMTSTPAAGDPGASCRRARRRRFAPDHAFVSLLKFRPLTRRGISYGVGQLQRESTLHQIAVPLACRLAAGS